MTESTQPTQLRFTLTSNRRVYAVSELNRAIQTVFEQQFSRIWVSGEISGCRLASSGHFYFALKDGTSQVKCVLFKGSARLLRFKPQEGLAVLASGSLDVYNAKGEYQLVTERLELHGPGSLQAAFDQLKTKLKDEGLFDPSRKLAIPALPRRIALITSADGAVLHDMLQVLGRRFPGLHIRLYPALVQGDAAVDQLCSGIQYLCKAPWADVIILARGGGSLEDLWCFNSERLARAIAASTIPIVSAIGHETDFTIADFVASRRAPTPSAAAEMIICTREGLVTRITECAARLSRAQRFQLLSATRALQDRGPGRISLLLQRQFRLKVQRADELDLALRRLQAQQFQAASRRLNDLARRLRESNISLRFARNHHRQEMLVEQLKQAWQKTTRHVHRRLDVAASHLAQLSPVAVLERGYAIVETPTGHILRSAAEAGPGDPLRVRLHRGELGVTVAGQRHAPSSSS